MVRSNLATRAALSTAEIEVAMGPWDHGFAHGLVGFSMGHDDSYPMNR